MRQAITIKKSHDGNWSVADTPETPFSEQRAKFNVLPPNKSEDKETAEVLLITLDRASAKRKTYGSPAKAAKKKTAKKD